MCVKRRSDAVDWRIADDRGENGDEKIKFV